MTQQERYTKTADLHAEAYRQTADIRWLDLERLYRHKAEQEAEK